MTEKIHGNIREEEQKKIKTEALLKELSIDIANKYEIKSEFIESLVKRETNFSLAELKEQIKNENNDKLKALSDKKLEKLFFSLKGAQEVIENLSKLEIKVLKDEVENIINIAEIKNTLEDYLPATLIEKAKNPKKLDEQILGIALGSANSIIATAEALYQIGKGILKAPYDLYLIIVGKGRYTGKKL